MGMYIYYFIYIFRLSLQEITDMKGVYIFLADGFEDCEALAVNDVLRRGGVDVKLVSIGDDYQVVSSHRVTVFADCMFEELDMDDTATNEKDFMIFPGGMPGSKNLAACSGLIDKMNSHYAAGGGIAAICAAPGLVFSQLESTDLTRFCCFDGFGQYLEAKGAVFENAPAVVCGRIITGRSAGHATSFGLAILREIKGEETYNSVKHALYLD